MDRQIHYFEDVHTHAASVEDWSQTYSQISAGSLSSSLMQIQTRKCHAFRERINQRVVQHGEAPTGKACFAIPITVPGSIQMQGRDADQDSVFFLRGGDEFMFHMPTGTDLLAITFDLAEFNSALEASPFAEEIQTLLRQPVIKVPLPQLAAARRRLLAMVTEAVSEDELTSTDERESEFEGALMGEMLSLLSDPGCDRSQRHATSTQSFVVERAHQLTLGNVIEAPSVMELCQRLHISRRTIQNSFRNVADTTPRNYLRSLRLNGVRRQLASTCASKLCIGDAASNWGFFHLSHFAAEYHSLFGELPSQTKRAAPEGSRFANPG